MNSSGVCATWIEPGPEQQRRAPAAEQRDVGRVRDRRDLEPVDRVEVLRGNVRARTRARPCPSPTASICFASGVDVAHEPEHQLGFARARERCSLRCRRGSCRCSPSSRRGRRRSGSSSSSSVGQQREHRLDRRLAEVRVRRVRGASARAHDDAQRSLRAARELALGRLAVDEELARRL